MLPLTFILQCVNNAFLLGSALLCLHAGRLALPNPYHRAAWRLAGAGFLVHALDLVVQHVFGGVALTAGNESATMHAYLLWLPILNHGRTFLIVGLLLGLLLLAAYRREPDARFWRVTAALMAVGFVVGTVLGVAEGRFTNAGHYSAVSVWDMIELLLLMATLFTLLLTSRADRALWGLLSAYGLSLALGVFSFTLLSQIGVMDAWHPPPWTLQAERMVCHLMMVGFATWRVAAAKRGRKVPAMLEHSARPVPTIG